MFRRLPLALCMAFALGLAQSAQAMSVRELRALEKNDPQGDVYALYYLVGLMEGTLEFHANAVRMGAAPSICPLGRRLEPRMAAELFDTELRRRAELYEVDMPAQLVMANALATVYPCN